MSISKININGTQHDLIASGLTDDSAEKIKLDATNIAYGTCSTAAGTAAKVVTLSGNTQWELKVGSLVTVKFTATNTAESPTLNVDGTGAYPIYYNASEYTSASSYGGYADRHITYQFNGTHWVFISWSYDSNSDTKVTQAAAITTAGEYPVMLGYSTSTSSVTNTLKKASTLKYNPSTQILTAPTFNGDLTGNADTATTADTLTGLTATVTELNYVDGVTSNIQTQLDGKAATSHTHPTFYGTSSTAADVLAKAVTVDSSFSLVSGAKITIKFTNANTIANPRINVNDLGSKNIYFNGAALVSSDFWKAGAVLDFVYDGTQWNLIGSSDTNVTTVTTDPSSNTTYFVPFSSAAQTGTLGINDGYKYYTRQGTTSALGYGRLWLGNSTASGTAGNKQGQIGLYGSNGNYTLYNPFNTSSSVTRYLVGTSSSAGVGTTNRPVYIDSTGLVTACSATSVEYGGTGATTAEAARTNLGVYSKSEVDAAISNNSMSYTYGTTDLTAGSSPLETGKLYFVYE